MGKIVAIGGGEISLKETFLIDQFIVEFSNKAEPILLFIPTASNDNQDYANTIKKVYGEELNCKVDVLNLIHENPSPESIKEKIMAADIIYVGGGNTLKMLEVWRENHVDQYLLDAYHDNTVLAGLSAGSICWFAKGYSVLDGNEPIGLGIIPAVHCPHYNKNGSGNFDVRMATSEIPGIALEDHCAFILKDDYYKIISTNSTNKAFLFKSGILEKKELVSDQYRPLKEILEF